jgi:hypothetical protein
MPRATIVLVPIVISLITASVIALINCTMKSPHEGPVLFFDLVAMGIPFQNRGKQKAFPLIRQGAATPILLESLFNTIPHRDKRYKSEV